MKKNLKRTLAKVMAVALTVSLLGTAADADAAKKIKLAKKSITITKGKSKKVAIKNVKAKKVKKLTVKSANKKVVTVKKKGKTAFTVKAKKVSKKAVKVTATLKLKGVKKATKLTLKVKVKAAKKKTTTTPSAAPSAAPSVAPSAAPSVAPTTGASAAPSEEPTQEPAKNEFGVSDPYVITISDENEAYATNNTKRVENGLDTDTYNKDTVYNTDGSVTYTSTSQYNTGVAYYIDPEVEVTQNDDGTTAYTAKKVDLTCYSKVRITVRDSFFETSFKILADGSSWWSKGETYEGQDDMTKGDRVIEYNLEEANSITTELMKEAEAIALGWNDAEGQTGTLVSIELVGKRDPIELKPGQSEEPSQAPSASPSSAPTQKPDTESGKVESGNVESGNVESGNVESGKTETKVEPVTLTGAALGENATFTHGTKTGLNKWTETAMYSFASSLEAVSKVTVKVQVTGEGMSVDDVYGYIGNDDKRWSGGVDANDNTEGTFEFTLNADTKVALAKKPFVSFKVKETKDKTFTGNVKITSVQIDSQEEITTDLGDKATYTYDPADNGEAAYTPLAMIAIPADVDLTKYSSIKIKFTTDDSTVVQATLVEKNDGTDAAHQWEADADNSFTLDISKVDAETLAKQKQIIVSTHAIGFKGTLTVTEVTFTP